MKFMLLIGGSHEAWARLSPSDWSDSRAAHGALSESGNFASGYYIVDCVDIDRACTIAAQLHEGRLAPIEVRRIGG